MRRSLLHAHEVVHYCPLKERVKQYILQHMSPDNSKTFASRDQRDYSMSSLELLSFSRRRLPIMLHLHGFTLGEGTGGLWLHSMGCHPLFNEAMVDSRATFGMAPALSDIKHVLKQRNQEQCNRPTMSEKSKWARRSE